MCDAERWMGPVEVSSPLDGERATMAILVWPQTLPCFFWDVSIFRVVSHNHQFLFLARNEYLGLKKINTPPNYKGYRLVWATLKSIASSTILDL